MTHPVFSEWTGHMAHKRKPIRKCVCCLYQVGMGVGKISLIVKLPKSSCFRFVRDEGILDASRTSSQRRAFNQKKRMGSIEIRKALSDRNRLNPYRRPPNHSIERIEKLIMEQIQSNLNYENRISKMWNKHREFGIYLSVKYQRERRKRDPIFAAIKRARTRLTLYCRNSGIKKLSSFSKMLGCERGFFKQHMERQFRDGMSWENRGTFWEIDHKIPLSSARTFEQIGSLGLWSNLQPLLVQENRDKGDTMPTDL